MHYFSKYFIFVFTLYCIIPCSAQTSEIPKLQNPVSVKYLNSNLRKKRPRLILNSKTERNLKKKLKTDPVVQNVYKAIQLNAAQIQKEPLLERVMVGRRLLATSREMLYRMNMLGMVYRMEKDPIVLKRINEELTAVCNFSDWNPSHYLDVAEMSLAVAIAVDWTAGALPTETETLAKNALIEKGIKPSYNKKGNTGWVNGNNNWNQVCNGGMIAASIVVAESDPELAAETISRSLDGIPFALAEYGPDGVYPEGSTYWSYGTSFSVITSAMLESAFNTDFGIAAFPAFQNSAVFRALSIAPSNWYYNFADCGDKRSQNGDMTLAWFAVKSGNPAFYEKERFLKPADQMSKLSRTDGAALIWLAQFEEKKDAQLPENWKGEGTNPIVIFSEKEGDSHGFYFGGKGGKGTTNHGNMDAGSFVFELNGVRWVVDPGNQNYNALEITGFDLWDRCQTCERWTLLTKNNFGHSTVTVNDALFVNDGFAQLTDFDDSETPSAVFDLTPVYGPNMDRVERRFRKESPTSLVIEDKIELSDSTELITWQLMTQADVEIVPGGAVLSQDGQVLKLENLSHPEISVSVISLDPPPLALDRRINGLKRIELRFPAWIFEKKEDIIKVRLIGE
jgi:hypothetical protein